MKKRIVAFISAMLLGGVSSIPISATAANYNADTEATFNYTGQTQTYTVSKTGDYFIEVAGAKGGNRINSGSYINYGGNGGKVKVKMHLTQGQVLYMNVGQEGIDWAYILETGGLHETFGGGGFGYHTSYEYSGTGQGGGSGGGSSDIRINGNSLSNRVVVAGGGGGASLNYNGGAGGGSGCGDNGQIQKGSNAYSPGAGGGGGYIGGSNGVNNAKSAMGGSNYYNSGLASIVSDMSGANGGPGYIHIEYIGNYSLLLKLNGGSVNNSTQDITYTKSGYSSAISSQEFGYAGITQTYIVPEDGTYRLEVWGAAGGGQSYGSGGYSSGYIQLKQGTILYINVGGRTGTMYGGWNGGGNSLESHGYGGGGATDISLYGTVGTSNWNTVEHLYSRIIVAGGGGGSDDVGENQDGYGGHGGGLYATTGSTGRQAGGPNYGYAFGYGGNGVFHDAGGGGGGWYGGNSAGDDYNGGGSGGSGYYYSAGTAGYYPAGCRLNSNYYLYSAQSTTGGNWGNGRAKITKADIVILPQPYKDGYTFTGYSVLRGGGRINDTYVFNYADGETVIQANYRKNEGVGSITINPNGGWYDNKQSNTIINRYNGASVPIYVPVRTGYIFKGWTFSGTGTYIPGNVANGLSGTYNFGYETNGYLTANWEIAVSSLTVDPNSGVYNNTIDKTYYLNMKYGQTQSIVDPTKVGYQFDYWDEILKSDGWLSEKIWHFNTKDGYLKAHWTPNTYTVNIYVNKPSNATNEVTKPVIPTGWNWVDDHYSKVFTYDATKIDYTPAELFALKGWTIDSTNYYSSNNGTGTKYNKGQINLTDANKATVNMYVKWTPNKYNIYYDKGLTSDTSTSIANATRNTNIQKTDTERPYTQAYYDGDVSFATLGSLKGRKYILTFDANIPASIAKQQNNSTANPTQIEKITGNLPSKNIWKITGQDYDVTKNLDVTMGSKISKPNYKATNNQSVTATALWNNKVLNNFSSPTLTGWKFIGWYDNQSGANSTAVSNTTDMIKTVNTATNTSGNTSVTTKHNVTSYTVQPKITDFKQTLYARWQRTITLTFNMNGGAYKGRKNDIVLTGIYYNNADGYTFMLNNTLTDMNLPDYEQQQNSIDAYGSYNDYGANNKYTKTDINGTRYRLCGWSTNKNATEPDSEFIVFDNNHKTSYKIYDDTVLYAVWEPILEVKYDINTTIDSATTNMINASTPGTFNVKASQGSGCNYTILASSIKDKDIVVKFDSKITDIYTHIGAWNDNLNPSTNEDLLGNQKHGLNRNISTTNKYIKRDFALPNKLGTRFSYTTSINVTTYTVETIVSQDSYYYNKFKRQPKETITITGTIELINKNTDFSGPDPRNPDDEYNGISNGIKTVIESDE